MMRKFELPLMDIVSQTKHWYRSFTNECDLNYASLGTEQAQVILDNCVVPSELFAVQWKGSDWWGFVVRFGIMSVTN